MMEDFFKAVKANNVALLEQILREKPIDINCPDKDGKTAFLIAAESADCTTLQWLVQQNAEIKAEYKTRTALYYVVLTYSGSPSVKAEKLAYLTTLGFTFDHASFALVCSNYWQDIKMAQTQDANFFIHQDRWGNNLLHYAAAWGNLAALEWIAEHMKVHSIDSQDTLVGITPLHQACRNGNLLVVKWLIEEGKANVKATNNKLLMTPLLCAAREGHLAIVQWLFQAGGASIKEKDNYGWTALHFAAANGHLEMMQWLLNEGKVQITEQANNTLTALLLAAQNGRLAIVQWLLQAGGAFIKEKDNYGWTALHFAAANGHLEMVQWLLTEGKAQISEKTNDNETALLLATTSGHLKIIQCLISQGASLLDRDKYGNTAILLAAKYNHLTILKWLLANGASLADQSNNQDTALLKAAISGHLEIIQYLINQGASLLDCDKYGNTALLLAVSYGHLPIVKWLYQQGTDLSVCDNDGDHALSVAATNGQLAIVCWLIEEANARHLIHALNNYNRTPIIDVAASGHLDIVQYLISQGACLSDRDNQGYTALLGAAYNGFVTIVEWLAQQHPALLKERTDEGESALLLAAYNGHLSLIQWLLTHGSSLEERDNNNENILSWAVGRGHLAVVRWLLEDGKTRHLIHEINCFTNTPMLIAAFSGHLKVMQYLASQQACLSDKNDDGFTPLLAAAENGHVAVVEWLVQQGASLDERNTDGDTSLLLAAERNQVEVVKFLINQQSSDYDQYVDALSALRRLTNCHAEPHVELVEFLIEKILSTISHHANRLDLSRINLTFSEWNQLLLPLKHYPLVFQIDLNDIENTAEPMWLGSICELLNENKILRVLSLKNNNLDDGAISKIADALSTNKGLERLVLSENDALTDNGVRYLLEKVIKNQSLVEIELNNVTYSSDLADRLQAYLERNQQRSRMSSMAAWTNVLRNVKGDDQTLDPNLPRASTNIASLQGYCTFFVRRKLSITTKFKQQQGWEAYYNNQRIELSQIIIEAIATGQHEYIEGITLTKS